VTGLLERPAAVGAPTDEIVALRRAGPADSGAVRDFLAGLSLHSAYRRFFTGIGAPSSTLVRRLVDVDHDRREAVLALAGAQVVGLADSCRLADDRTVEIGVVVADAWQRIGLGPRLTAALLALAAERGATTLRVHALAENAVVARLLRRQWPECSPTYEDATLTWTLPLP
jgi:acetyltransferase